MIRADGSNPNHAYIQALTTGKTHEEAYRAAYTTPHKPNQETK
jgi:hypothetical protein